MQSGDVRNVAINIIAGVLLFGLGVVSRQLASKWRSVAVGRFWRVVAKHGMTVVMGSLDRREFLDYEPSGVVGTGDVRAFYDLAEIASRARLRRFAVAFGGVLNDEQRRGNLVLLGGVDGNPLSANLMRDLGSRIELMNEDKVNPPVLLDHISQPPLRLQPDLKDGRVVHDYGIVVRARNPREPQNWVVIIAGCLGYATWAGARLTTSKELAHAPLEFECVYRVQTEGGSPTQLIIISGPRQLANK